MQEAGKEEDINKKVYKAKIEHENILKKAKAIKSKTCWICGRPMELANIEFLFNYGNVTYRLIFKCPNGNCNGTSEFLDYNDNDIVYLKEKYMRIFIEHSIPSCECDSKLKVIHVTSMYNWPGSNWWINARVHCTNPECRIHERIFHFEIADACKAIKEYADMILSENK